MKKLCLFLTLLLSAGSTIAQTQEYPWAVGVYLTKNEYLGDMRVYSTPVTTGNRFNSRVNTILNFNMFHAGGALSLDRYLNRFFDLGIYTSFGNLGYSYNNEYDHDLGYSNRNFEASIANVNLHTRIKFLGQSDGKWTPYAVIGVGGLGYFDISTKVNAIKGDYSVPQDRSNYSTVKNTYEDTPAFAGIISGGLGLEYKINNRFGIRYQAEVGWTTADKYDMYAAKGGNDWQLQHSLGVVYNWGATPKKILSEIPVTVYVEPIKETPVVVEEMPIIVEEAPVVVEETPIIVEELPIVVEEPVKETPIVEELKQEIGWKHILFEKDKDTFQSDAQTVLDEFVKELNVFTGHLLIKGHTDNIGTAKYNLNLSLRRAGAVKKYFVQQGIDGSRITVIGLGGTQPIGDNDTEQGRAANRRVEFIIEE